MKSSGISEIKLELASLPQKKVFELCLKLAKYKKENKELLSYLLFDAQDENGFIEKVKTEIDTYFTDLPKANAYLIKKSLRKILRIVIKHSRHSGIKASAIEMLMHFCFKLKGSGIPIERIKVLSTLYEQQLKKIHLLIEYLHEDLKFDYKKQMKKLL